MLRAKIEQLKDLFSPRGWGLAAAVAWLALNLCSLEGFPTVFIDEAENGNHAYNAAFHGESVFTLYDGLYPPRLEFLRQSWPPVIRPLYIWPLAALIKVTGFGLARARLFSLGAGFLCLVLVFRTGVILGGDAWGLSAALLLSTYFPFLYSSHSVRPEALLALNGALVLWTLLRGLGHERAAWFAAAGILAGLAPGVHTNGITLIVPVFVILLGTRRWRGAFWALAGWLTGTLIFIRLADWERFVPGYYALFFRDFTALPLLSEKGNLLSMLINEAGRYFGNWIFPHWHGGLAFARLLSVQHVVFAAAIVWGMFRTGRTRIVAAFTGSLALAYAFLIGQKASNYLAALAPFFALSAAGWLEQSRRIRFSAGGMQDRAQAVRAGVALAGWTVLATAAAGSGLLVLSILLYRPSFQTLASRFSAQIPAQARVAGPQILWLGIPSEEYRDIGALVWHRMLLNEKNLWAPLEKWKPDYLILDHSMGRRLARLASAPHQPVMRGPTGILPWPHRVLDFLQTGPAYDDSMALVQIDWPRKSSP